MAKLYYFEFFPKYRDLDRPVILEVPVGDFGTAKRLFKEYGGWEDDHLKPFRHNTLESATARERGCEYRIDGDEFFYKEKQGITSKEDIEYTPFNRYMNIDFQPKTLNGEKLQRAIIVYRVYTEKILREWGVTWIKKVTPIGFDGCTCRNCNSLIYMGEPDGLTDDGMLTCYLCKDRMKGMGTWKYHLKDLKEKNKSQYQKKD